MKNAQTKTELVNAINAAAGADVATERMTRAQLEALFAIVNKPAKPAKDAKPAKPTHTPKSTKAKDAKPARKMRRITSKRDFTALLKSLEAAGIEPNKIEVQASTLWVNSPNKAQRDTLRRLGFIGNKRARRNNKPNGMFCKRDNSKAFDMRKWYTPAA